MKFDFYANPFSTPIDRDISEEPLNAWFDAQEIFGTTMESVSSFQSEPSLSSHDSEYLCDSAFVSFSTPLDTNMGKDLSVDSPDFGDIFDGKENECGSEEEHEKNTQSGKRRSTSCCSSLCGGDLHHNASILRQKMCVWEQRHEHEPPWAA
ncbi:hypothetical protein ADUPG1_014162 [Aduncisulcus paluster]|uniref:Uncharacterized protein n=1 Tax=Aduncisulcus paluster TaxID=2918883 RepID=A0ABQ5KAZ7_9EUKA|nr:hypothetical protein ADUPG1_014162 [Aduncisulcus paluster]|eukprot:gnl/Carplike_NY0171/56_a78_8588.p1 GENE.gnl/Carplike_NY0171/56_a78_8588~~gnl/Carplike_NY0171/56_a78_8588.p1  ORF type:complete len:151 (-),score=40.33 gnl/Carplike_NY0171/56_a78_8588:307-759(-)